MFDTDDEIAAYIADLQGGIDEFRELIGSGRIAGVRRQRGQDYLQRLDARAAGEVERRQLEAPERAAAAAETSAGEAKRQSTLAARSARIAVISCIVTAIVGVASVVGTVNQKLGGVAALHPARRTTTPRPRVAGRGIVIFDLRLAELETSALRQIDNTNAVLLHQLSNLGERQLALVRESFVHFPLDCVAFSDEFLISLG